MTTEAFDTKHAGRELRGLINDVIADHTHLNGGNPYGAKSAAARTLGLHKKVFDKFVYENQSGAGRATIERVCKHIGMSVDEFMSDRSYSRGRRGAR